MRRFWRGAIFLPTVFTIHGDRRKAARLAINVPIRVSQSGIGSTIDISSAGVLFVIEADLEPGMAIEFAMTMDETSGPLELHCGGTVVRVQRRDGMSFTAATIDTLAVQQLRDH
jgi:hypothetical protein